MQCNYWYTCIFLLWILLVVQVQLVHIAWYLKLFSFFLVDTSGKLRIWDTTQKEHILKNEFQPFGGPIKDLAWSGDSQKIAVVGEGREK